MSKLKKWIVSGITAATAIGVIAAGFGTSSSAQDKKDPDAAKYAQRDPAGKDLAGQIAELRAQVSRLEATLSKMAPSGAGGIKGMQMGGPGMSGGGMGMMDGQKKPMGGMDMDMMMGGMAGGNKGMGGMSGSGMGMMDDMDMMGMMGMGSMGGPKGMKMKMTAALPGFPGASHIYHIGATDFFLDHPEHITLSTEQQTKLNKAKQKSMTDKASAQRKIEQAEQELWELTASDQPDATKIETKVREIEKLRGDQRLGFIRSVGETAKVLTDEQRQVLLGTAQPKLDKPHKHAP